MSGKLLVPVFQLPTSAFCVGYPSLILQSLQLFLREVGLIDVGTNDYVFIWMHVDFDIESKYRLSPNDITVDYTEFEVIEMPCDYKYVYYIKTKAFTIN